MWAIAAVAARQNGNITRRQLLDLGLDDDAIACRVKIGRLFRVFRASMPSAGRPSRRTSGPAPLSWRAGRAPCSRHSSAMALWGFWRRWDTPFEITVVRDRRPKGIRVHRSTTLRRRDVTTHMGIRATSPARTVLDVSPRQTDRALKRMVNNALNSQWLTEDQLADTLGLHPTLPGATRIAKLIGLDGTPPRSQLGRRLSRLLRGPRLAGAGDGRAVPRAISSMRCS